MSVCAPFVNIELAQNGLSAVLNRTHFGKHFVLPHGSPNIGLLFSLDVPFYQIIQPFYMDIFSLAMRAS